MKNALVMLSGGQDSTTCLYLAKHRYDFDKVHALTFNYGQRHRFEIYAAVEIALFAKVDTHEIINLGNVLKGTSPLINQDVGVETYVDAKALPGGIEKTFVPMRNALFLVLAFNRAAVLGCSTIFGGMCKEDAEGYPDCRKSFLDVVNIMGDMALDESVGHPPKAIYPLLDMSKAETVRLAAKLPGCLEALALSHTCYQGSSPPCGSCHACLLRARGFAEAGIPDPLIKM